MRPFGKSGSREGRRARLRRYASLFALLPIVTLDLAACSFFAEEEEAQPRIAALQTLDEDPAYPNLATVPDQAPLPSSRVRRLDLQQGLAADRENAIYTDEDLRADPAILPLPQQAATPAPSPRVAAPAPALPEISAPPPPDYIEQGDSPPPPEIGPAPTQAPAAVSSPALPEPPAQPSLEPVLPDYATSPQVDATAPATVLLQQQAVQVQVAEAQRLQAMVMQQQAMAEQARLQAIEQQRLRQQIIDRNAYQLQTLQQQARAQMAALPQAVPAVPQPGYPVFPPQAPAPLPAPVLPVTPAYPQQPPGQPPAPSYPQVAAAYPPASPTPGAEPLGGDGFSAAQSAPGSASGAPSGQLVGLIYFGHGSSGLDDNDRQVLRQIAAIQAQAGGRPIRVVGHASSRTSVVDPVKHRMANLAISKRRAESVAKEFMRLGLSQGQVSVVARADSQPVYHEFMPTGEAGNRRVEIFIQ